MVELGESWGENHRILELKEIILKSGKYEELAKDLFLTIVETRKEMEEAAKVEKEREFELEKLRIQTRPLTTGVTTSSNGANDESEYPKWELRKLIPNFNLKEDKMGLFLNIFERQLRFMKIPEDEWVAYLIGALPADVAKLIAGEPEEESRNYEHIKSMLLKQFKLSAERFPTAFLPTQEDTREYLARLILT